MAIATIVLRAIGSFLRRAVLRAHLACRFVYATARHWYGDRMMALLAGALLAVNPLVFHVQHPSHERRSGGRGIDARDRRAVEDTVRCQCSLASQPR